MAVALRTIDYLHSEREFVPWSAALKELGYVDRMLRTDGLFGAYKVRMVELVLYGI
jgi:hypothetical protein